MSNPQPVPATPGRWKRPAYLVIVVAAVAMVVSVWFHLPTIQVESASAESGYSTVLCTNGGQSRWDPPTVRASQEVTTDQRLVPFNQQILRMNIDSLRQSVICGQARDAHTNTLIVTTFAAGAILFFGYQGLWVRRATEPTPAQ